MIWMRYLTVTNNDKSFNREKNFASAVLYVHNSQQWIGSFLKTVISVMEDNFEYSEIICVNDHSDDGSVGEIKKCAETAEKTSITVVNLSYFHGLEAAMNAGMDLTIGDFVFEFDRTVPDFSEDMIMKVYRRCLEGYDIVSASPDRNDRFTSRMFYAVFDRFSDVSYDMTTESFRILSRRVINRIRSMNKSVPYRKAVYANCGLKTDNIRYDIVGGSGYRRDRKEAKYRSGLAMDVLILFTDMGYRFGKAMTLFMMFMSVFMLVYSVVIYLLKHPVAGWTTTILFLSVSFLGLFGILTIIIKYLQLLVNLVFKRKNYSFESIEKLTGH